jgi:DNA polymerase-3 subunit gamma/tau
LTLLATGNVSRGSSERLHDDVLHEASTTMTTDDRDTESGNPSKSFQVGEFDRLSGFFTPVWESKRRLRSESPIPSSSAAASAPSSARSPGSDTAAGSRPSVPPPAPSRRSNPPPAKADGAHPARPSRPPPAPSSKKAGAEREPATSESSRATSVSSAPALAAAPADATPIAAPTASALDPSAADVVVSDASVADADATQIDAVTVRPVIPMPNTPGRVPQRSKPASSTPPGPDEAPQGAGDSLGLEAPIEREPDLRSPPPAARAPIPAALQRAARTAAAIGLQDRFAKVRPHTDSADTFARHRETESEREAAVAAAARAAATAPADPYPSHVLRSLRRTIHLSTPLPDAVRQMIEKYRY